jgi:superfamily II DNA/RNA helicase
VGRTGRAGAWGTASTFSTRSERGEIRHIERTLNVRLLPREVAADLMPEERPAPRVIGVQVDSRQRAGAPFASGRRNAWRR